MPHATEVAATLYQGDYYWADKTRTLVTVTGLFKKFENNDA